MLTSHAQNRWCKKMIKFWTLHSALRISSQTSKRFNAVIGSIAINVRLTCTDFPEKITSKASIIMSHATVVQNGLEYRICQKTKESERKNISDRNSIIVQQFQEAYPLSRASSNTFLLSFDRAGAPNLFVTTVVRPMMMVSFGVMFSGNYFYKNRKMMPVELWMSALILLLVWCDSWHRM